MTNETEMLEMALVGYRKRMTEIEARLRELKPEVARRLIVARLPGLWPDAPTETENRRRTMSPEARRRIAAAQKKRWAKYRRLKAA